MITITHIPRSIFPVKLFLYIILNYFTFLGKYHIVVVNIWSTNCN